jgi:hypothetical protein
MIFAPKNSHYDMLMTSPHAVNYLQFMLKGVNTDIPSQSQQLFQVLPGFVAESVSRSPEEMRNSDQDLHAPGMNALLNPIRAAADSLREINQLSGDATNRNDIEKIMNQHMKNNNIASDGDKQVYLSTLMGGQAVQYARGQEASLPEQDMVTAGQQMACVAEIILEHENGVAATPKQVDSKLKSAFKTSGVSIEIGNNTGDMSNIGNNLMESWNRDVNAGCDHQAMDDIQNSIIQMQRNDLTLAMENSGKMQDMLNEFVASEDKNTLFTEHMKNNGDPKSFFDVVLNRGKNDMPTTRVEGVLNGITSFSNNPTITRGGVIAESNQGTADNLLESMRALGAASAPFMQDDSMESMQMVAFTEALQNTLDNPNSNPSESIASALSGHDQGLAPVDEAPDQAGQAESVSDTEPDMENDNGLNHAPAPKPSSWFGRTEADAYGRRGLKIGNVRIVKKPPQFANDADRLAAMDQWAKESKQNIQDVAAGLPRFCADFLYNIENFLQATLGGGIADQKYGKKINDAKAAQAKIDQANTEQGSGGNGGKDKKGREQTHIVEHEAVATPTMGH